MPVLYQFEGRVFRITNQGESTFDEIIETYLAALDDPDFPDDAVLLWDTTQSTSLVKRTPEELQKITQILGPAAVRHSNCTAIVSSSDLYYGLMRMTSTFGSEFDTTTRVFRSEAEALEWIHSLDSNK